ncbi:MAG: tripartite tricarboxylate transporter substrate binding protein [Burkholderiales bacterium]|nr:tripartite tricarboxylate transporter substrate binding protein [Burkholderiales bacterium]
MTRALQCHTSDPGYRTRHRYFRYGARRLALRAGMVLCLALSTLASAADWSPARPIRLILPYAPGGTTDLIARIIAVPLGNDLGQQVVVDNRGGGGGVIAMSLIARAQADGYTLGLPSLTAHAATATLLQKSLPYDVEKDFAPVTFIGQSPLVLVVGAANPAESLGRLIARSKETGRPISFASGGIGLAAHIAGELVKLQSGETTMTHVPYKGGGPAAAGVMGGQVDMLFAPVGTVLSLVRGGKLRAIAVASRERSPKLPGTATMIESGFPNFLMADSWGLLAPAGLPAAPLRRLHDTLTGVLKQPEVAKRLDDQGIEIEISTPRQLQEYIAAEVKKYRDVIVRANIKVE